MHIRTHAHTQGPFSFYFISWQVYKDVKKKPKTKKTQINAYKKTPHLFPILILLLPSCSSLLSLAAAGSSWIPRPNRSVSSLCLKEITVCFWTSAAFAANCTSSSERSESRSSRTGNVFYGNKSEGGGRERLDEHFSQHNQRTRAAEIKRKLHP